MNERRRYYPLHILFPDRELWLRLKTSFPQFPSVILLRYVLLYAAEHPEDFAQFIAEALTKTAQRRSNGEE